MNGSAPLGSTPSPAASSEGLEQALEGAIENLRQLVVMVEDYQATSQPALFGKINGFVQQLEQLESKRHECDIDVPLAVLKYIDEGRNPDLYVKECLEDVYERNEQTKGKLEVLQKFKSALELEANRLYPEDFALFKSLYSDDGGDATMRD